MEVSGRTIPGLAAELPPDEAAAWWSRIFERDASYERYARATERTIPVLRLTPKVPPGSPA